MTNKKDLVNFEKAFDYGWLILKTHWVFLFQIALITFLIGLPFGIIDSLWNDYSSFETLAEMSLYVIFRAIYYFVYFTLIFNSMKIYLGILHGRHVQLSDLFTMPTKQTLNFFFTSTIYCIMIFAGLICFIVPGVYFAMKYMFATTIVVDKNLGVLEAAELSAKITDGAKWSLLGYAIIMGFCVLAMIIVGLIFLIVGIIPALFIGSSIATFGSLEIYKKLLQAN